MVVSAPLWQQITDMTTPGTEQVLKKYLTHSERVKAANVLFHLSILESQVLFPLSASPYLSRPTGKQMFLERFLFRSFQKYSF